MKGRRGFTLIELLIVVAIISVLAGVALANFTEARTRSRVAAVKNDLRVLAGALETYRTDHNRYPPAAGVGAAWNEFGSFAEPLSARMYALTTPVAYLSGIPRDAFPLRDGWLRPDLQANDTFDYVDADAVPERGSGLTSGGEWRLSSPGPDLYQSYGGRPMNETNLLPHARGVDYDPTNGTSSWGDIVRVGPECRRHGDPLDPKNPNRPAIVRVPQYVEQWRK